MISRPTAVRAVRPWGGAPVDLILEDGRISAMSDPVSPDQWSDSDLDGQGLLALPSIVNTHAHVDKS